MIIFYLFISLHQRKNKMINEVKNSRDYADICYMVKHVNETDILFDVLSKLGYRIGTIIVKNDYGVGHVTIDKQKNYRIQITPKYKNINIANCVILNKNEIVFNK